MKALISCLIGILIGVLCVSCTSSNAKNPEVLHWTLDSESEAGTRFTYLLTDTETNQQYIAVKWGLSVVIFPRLEK